MTCSKDHANSSEDEDEKPPVPKFVLSAVGPSGESMEWPDIAYKSPTLGEREGAKLPQMTFEMEHGTPFPLPRKSIWPRPSMGIVPLTKTKSEPDIARVTTPLASVVHQERTFTPAMPLETTVESNTRLVGQEPATSVSGGDPGRPFTLKNVEAPGKFFGKGTPAATT